MNEQRNEAVWYFVMSVLIGWICLKTFYVLGIVGHFLLVIAIGLMAIGFIKLPMIKNRQHERYNHRLHQGMQLNEVYQKLKLSFDEEMGDDKTTIYVDSRHNKWFVIQKEKVMPDYERIHIFDFCDIVSVELINERIFQMNHRNHQNTDEVCTRLEVQMITRNIKMPEVNLIFITSEISCASKQYRRLLREAEYIKAILTSMKYQGNDELYGWGTNEKYEEGEGEVIE
ncbi:hypothetical protein [Turicibacter bilis]|uniref:Uncharacterized protein n=1 Tax=Turicibacter bilis TaxID=2735723 RepID=A0ABY5JHR2_9FIRM|nr:hypothetical protein [Turicibacter bilis]MBS3199779.1 hypothetical protein [Turicibacter bilis]UUF06244.1 hypothetical protein J0J69_01240 [Turicibacter bilis]